MCFLTDKFHKQIDYDPIQLLNLISNIKLISNALSIKNNVNDKNINSS